MMLPYAPPVVRMTRAGSCPPSPAVLRDQARPPAQVHTLAPLTAAFLEVIDRAAGSCLISPELFNAQKLKKGKKYGNSLGCFVRCRLGGASGLHSA